VAPPVVVADAAGAAYVQPQALRFPYSGPARDVATTLHYRAMDDSGQAAVCVVKVVVDDLERPRIDCHDDLAVRDGATRPGRLYGTPADGVAIQAADVRDNSGETLTTTPLVRGLVLTNTTKFYYAGRDGARRSGLFYRATDSHGNEAVCETTVEVSKCRGFASSVGCDEPGAAQMRTPAVLAVGGWLNKQQFVDAMRARLQAAGGSTAGDVEVSQITQTIGGALRTGER
jgi:hypothetical protein